MKRYTDQHHTSDQGAARVTLLVSGHILIHQARRATDRADRHNSEKQG